MTLDSFFLLSLMQMLFCFFKEILKHVTVIPLLWYNLANVNVCSHKSCIISRIPIMNNKDFELTISLTLSLSFFISYARNFT